MAKFSDRMGLTHNPEQIQIDSMNDDLRNSLWNWLVEVLRRDGGQRSIPKIWKDYFKNLLDTLSSSDIKNLAWLRNPFMAAEWYEPYNMIEFVVQGFTSSSSEAGVLEVLQLPKR